jgi:hypothetical protein
MTGVPPGASCALQLLRIAGVGGKVIEGILHGCGHGDRQCRLRRDETERAARKAQTEQDLEHGGSMGGQRGGIADDASGRAA